MRVTVLTLVVFLTVAGCSKQPAPATGDPGSEPAADAVPTEQPLRPANREEWITFGSGSLTAGCWFTSSNGYSKDNADGSPSVVDYRQSTDVSFRQHCHQPRGLSRS